MAIPMKAIPGYENSKPGIQVGAKMQGPITLGSNGRYNFDKEGVAFLQQMGVEWVMVPEVPVHSAKAYKELKEQMLEHGLKIYRLANRDLHCMSGVTLNLPDRDELIDRYLQFITDLGEAGIRYATYAHMVGIWRGTEKRPVRGGAMAGGLDLKASNKSIRYGDFGWPLSHGRTYSENEMWDNYEYFIKKVVPVAESAGVRIGLHPDDPPGYTLAGVPRCVFGSFEAYKRALEIADSPYVGVCLCVGCWLEGGEKMGCTPEEFIRYLQQHKKLFKLHMRNVTAPLGAEGGFNETFPDAGYYNLVDVLQTLDETGFDGCIVSDHLIDMVGGAYACEAYFTAYLKGAVAGVANHRAATPERKRLRNVQAA